MVSIRFAGLREFDRALGRADKDLRSEFRRDLKDVAEVVAEEARSIAESKGLRRSGDLIQGIRPFATASGAGVRSSARHRGFPYPRRLEFEDRQGGRFGPRASLLPAVKDKEAELTVRAERLLDRVVHDLSYYG